MRGKQTVRGMVQSLAVTLAAAFVVYLFIPREGPEDPVPAIDYRVELVTARRAAPYPVAAPAGLPEGWKPTSVTYSSESDNAWHLGYLDPDDQYVAIEQSTAPVGKWIPEVTQQAARTDRTETVGGATWQRWEGQKYDALVRTDKGSTTVITGTASFERLAQMAAALKTS
ncbi:DUF4245 domain-containing protein [Streptomyces sp. NPDC000410]|uniref:DUF4245 domain-containing protein n=1 Tax=Streptomyces sp. NPDC000410 TaxID=3154254 RepID=UPI0033189EB5